MGWIGVDLDGVLAEYHGWPKDGGIGAPVAPMVERVQGWLLEGRDVRIFTARIWPLGTSMEAAMQADWAESDGSVVSARTDVPRQLAQIKAWSLAHIGRELPVTCVKDYGMITLYDDRCVQVERNTGKLLGEPL